MRSQALEPLSISCYGHQIDAIFTVFAKVRQASIPIALNPIPVTPTAAAPVCHSTLSPDFPACTALG